MRASFAALAAALSIAFLGSTRCALPGGAESDSLSILSYNVKSLFDASDEGTEFPEFSVAQGRWDEAGYKRRLDATAKAVLAAMHEKDSPPGPDLLCLVEIENEGVLSDLSTGPLAAAKYRYSAIAPTSGGPFASALLSRLPLRSLACHALAPSTKARGRAIIEAVLDARGRPLVVLICHWKSRVGGARQTEEERREAAALVRSLVAAHLASDPDAELLVCGDFNESPDEWERAGRAYPTAFMPADSKAAIEAGGASRSAGGASRSAADSPASAAPVGESWRALPRLLLARTAAAAGLRDGEPVLYSPWAESEGYSYSYKGERERLDGFLLAPGLLDGQGLTFRGFSPVDSPFLLDAAGVPIAWSSSSGKGYSDHLPILLLLDRVQDPRRE